MLLLGLCFLTAAAIAAAAEESDFTEADVPDMVAQGEEWVNKRNFDGAKVRKKERRERGGGGEREGKNERGRPKGVWERKEGGEQRQ